jgi:hypothetical protein
VLTALALPLRFDPRRLAADLATVAPSDWAPHYNERDYGGQWRGAALRSSTGDSRQLAAVAPSFEATPLLDRCAYFRQVLAAFECPLRSVRLLALDPGSFIREHTDNALAFEDGEARIHIPIETNPGVEFHVDGERLLFEPGRAYYVNVNLPHRVNNRGAGARIHLVIDAAVNDWLSALFARATPVPNCPARLDGVEAFRDAVFAHRDWAATLRASTAFTDDTLRLGRETGFDFHENDVDAMLRGRARPGPPGGLPISLGANGVAEWIDAGDLPLPEPFFEDSVRAILRNPYARFSRRTAPLPDASKPPSGLIFHVSRCGSTLAARMLSAAGLRVLSEPPPLDAAIQSGQIARVRSIAAALGAGMPYILKLDAWHIHALPLIRLALPETRWIFLYRDPVEVLASHARSPGRHMLPGGLDPRALGLRESDITAIPRAEWPARILARMMDSALSHAGPAGLFIDYRDLPAAVEGRVVDHFGLTLDAASRERMREVSREDAKRPGAVFAPDSAAKQDEGVSLRNLELDNLYTELRRRSLRAHQIA